MNKLRKLPALLTAAVCAAAFSGSVTAAAASGGILSGDLNGDGSPGTEDIRILTDHLTTQKPLTDRQQAAAADLDGDGRLTAADLTCLKRMVLTQSVPDPDALLKRPLDALSPTMPAVGKVRVLLLAVSFPDCAHEPALTDEQITAQCFGPADSESLSYPMESISAYYQRASYNRLTIEGDAFQYTAKDAIGSYAGYADKLTNEIFAALDDTVDFSRYDFDRDGVMDAVIIAVPGNADKTAWHPHTNLFPGRQTYDGVRIGSRSIGRGSLKERAAFNSTWAHELGHAMGLPDYYKYENQTDGYYGLNGDAGWELMDDAGGDLSAFSKLMLGWYAESEIQIYRGGTQSFRLESAQNVPSLLLIPRGELNGFLSEYFILEYQTAAGNNHAFFSGLSIYKPFQEGGLRILHCDATVCQGVRAPELKWNNYGKYYDKSNGKQRILRLADEAEGGTFFRTGETVTGSVSGFRWYDDSGGQTVDPGLKVTVSSISDGICSVTVSQS